MWFLNCLVAFRLETLSRQKKVMMLLKLRMGLCKPAFASFEMMSFQRAQRKEICLYRFYALCRSDKELPSISGERKNCISNFETQSEVVNFVIKNV